MPLHDWTRVEAGLFHSFHLSWLHCLMQSLNGGLLPEDYYALIDRDGMLPPQRWISIRSTPGDTIVAILRIETPRDNPPSGESDPDARLDAMLHRVILRVASPEHRLMASYRAGRPATAYLYPVALAETLPDVPLFLRGPAHVMLPLESTYQQAWLGVPRVVRHRLGP